MTSLVVSMRSSPAGLQDESTASVRVFLDTRISTMIVGYGSAALRMRSSSLPAKIAQLSSGKKRFQLANCLMGLPKPPRVRVLGSYRRHVKLRVRMVNCDYYATQPSSLCRATI